MAARGVNRIVIGVENLDDAVTRYEQLLGTKFHIVPAEHSTRYGSLVAISWEAGIELVARAPGAPPDQTGLLPKKIGFMGVVFGVDDLAAARNAAQDLGLSVTTEVHMDSDKVGQLLGRPNTSFDQIVLDKDALEVPVLIATMTEQ